MKKSRCIVIVMLIAVLFTSINPESIVYANQKTIVPSAIRYSEDNKQAEILFNVEGVDKEEYELVTIVSNCDDEVVYDGTQGSEEITYTVKENGEYNFTIRYIEKQEEKTTEITACVTEINTTEEMKIIEESDTETDIDEEVPEEVSIATLSDSSATTSTDTIKFNVDNFPDETLRKWIKDKLGFTENQDLTQEDITKALESFKSTSGSIIVQISTSSISEYAGIESTEGLQYFEGIEQLVLTGSSISSISSEYLPKSLESLTISNASNLTEIDLSNSSNFYTLTASNDKSLTTLKLPQTIIKLTLSDSGLSGEWNFSSYTSLEYLDVQSTNITVLDISGCNSLINLYAWYNESLINIEMPTVASSPLASVYISNTGLSGEWDFSQYTSLLNLYITDTNITGINLSGCTSLHTLNVSNTPLAYLKLPNPSAVSSFTANSLSRDIESLALSVSEELGLYINLDELFDGINEIDINKISGVNVSNGIYDENSKIIKNITDDFTVTYQYDTGDTSYSITTTINVTIDISGLLPTVTGVDGDFGISSTIGGKDKLLQYGKAKRYDGSYYTLSEIDQKVLTIKDEKYSYFDYSTNDWVGITEEELLNFEKGIGIYAYEFTVQDTRDSKLVSTGVSRFFVGGDTSYIQRSSDNCYVLIYNSGSISIKETVIAAKYSNETEFKSYLESAFACQGYQDNGGLEIKKASVVYDYTSISSISTPIKLTPGDYTLTVNLKSNDTPSESKIEKGFTVTVTANPYSYDLEVDEASTLEGISGYLIIPKYIVLENTDGDNLSAEVEVKFANYKDAAGVTYSVSVEKSFEITNTTYATNTITVTTSSTETGVSEQDGKLNLGAFTTDNISSGKKIKFTATKTEAPINSKWEGEVTFYFSRTS